MKIFIIEDEEIAVEHLTMLLKRHDFNIEIVGAADSIKGALHWLDNNPRPDLIFLDIYLSDGLSFDIFKSGKLDIPVIFTTAYDNYALKAFELLSVDYLLKPINKKQLGEALEKFQRIFPPTAQQAASFDYEQFILNFAKQRKSYKERFLVKMGNNIASLPTDQIAYFFALEKVVLLVTRENRQLPVDYSLEELTELLDPAKFFRASRQYIISFQGIESIQQYSNSRVKIRLIPRENKELIISNDRMPSFRNWLDA